MRSRKDIESSHARDCGQMREYRFNKYVLETLLDIRDLLKEKDIVIENASISISSEAECTIDGEDIADFKERTSK